MACVRKRRGKWVVDFTDQNGCRRWETVKGTRKAADDILAARIREISHGTYRPRSDEKTFAELAQAFVSGHVDRNLRHTTQRDYMRRINQYLTLFFGRTKKARKIDFEMVQDFRKWMVEQGKGPRTINKCTSLLGSIFRFGIKLRWVDGNPAERIGTIKAPRSSADVDGINLPRLPVLLPKQVQKLIGAYSPREERWRLIVLTAVLTGLRQGEILGLFWGDILWSSKQIAVRRTWSEGRFYEPKTKKSRRLVDMPPVLMMGLKKWREAKKPLSDDELVFGNGAGKPENPSNLMNRGFYPQLARAGLKIPFHGLRHTYASVQILNGQHAKYIQEQMGHSSIMVTMDIYGHLMQTRNEKASQLMADTVLGKSRSPRGKYVAKR